MNCYNNLAFYCDKLISEDIDYRDFGNRIISLCNSSIDYNSYLDLACGTGNLTEVISPYFKDIWAVDISIDMLSQAESKLRKLNKKINFICEDICKVNLYKQFDLITCCLDSVNYILEEEEIKSFFKNVYNHLKDNGLFIFDINSYYKLSEVMGNNTFTYDDESLAYIWNNYFHKDILEMDIIFFIREGQVYKRFDENHTERAYKEEFIENIINEQGFYIVEKNDSYSIKEVNKHTERIVYTLKKLERKD